MPITVAQQKPGLGEMLGLGMGQGISEGISQKINQLLTNQGQQTKNAQQLAQSYKKLKANAPQSVDRFLKSYKSGYAENEAVKEQIYKNYLNQIDEAEKQGIEIDPNLALDMAISQFESSPERKAKQNIPPWGKLSEEYPHGIASLAAKHPGEMGAGMAIDLGLRPFETLSSLSDPTKLFLKAAGKQSLSPLSDQLSEKSGVSGLPEQAKQELMLANIAASGLPINKLLNILGLGKVLSKFPGLSKLFGTSQETQNIAKGGLGGIGSDVEKAKQVLSQRQKKALGESIFEQVKPNLEQIPKMRDAGESITKPFEKIKEMPKGLSQVSTGVKELSVPGKAQIVRTERTSPEARLFQSEKEIKLREQQLKEHPKYEAEIAKDAEERTARLAKQSEKGPVAQATQAQKMAYYETEVPKVRDLYEKASARVRALENSIVQSRADKAQISPLLDAAKKELQETEYLLRQTINNAKTGEARVGFDKMKKAAQDKILDLQNKISEGETVQFSKKDYNPEFIQKAKELGKRKPLSAKKQSDYFTQVHDGYADVYRNRIAQIDNEMAATEKGLHGLQKRQHLQEEKNALQKLVDHVEAENKIHRHKMALRELAERKKAAERLKSFKKQPGSEKVKKAGESIKTQKHFNPREAGEKAATGSAEETKTAVNEATEQAAKTNPSQAEKILKERDRLRLVAEAAKKESKAATGDLRDALNQVKQEGSKPAATRAGNILAKQWRETIDSLTGVGPSFFKTQTGRDFLWGFGIDTAEELWEEATGQGLPSTIKGALKTPILLSRGIGIRVSPSKGLGTFFSDYIWEKWKVGQLKSALKGGNTKEYSRLKEKYKHHPSLLKKAKQEVNK